MLSGMDHTIRRAQKTVEVCVVALQMWTARERGSHDLTTDITCSKISLRLAERSIMTYTVYYDTPIVVIYTRGCY